jgi:lipopolysaccharide transport system ATP-binding protein
MTDNVVIRVEGLSKSYQISHQAQQGQGYRRLSEDLVSWASWPLRKVKGFLNHQDLGKPTVEEFWALKDVSFEVKRGEVIGIIGRNGAGKSTLLKILSRIVEPTRGRVEIDGRVASLLEVGTGFHPELTGRENIYLNGAILGMSRAEIKSKFDEIVDFAEVEKFLDTPVKRYSSGMYVRLAFAVAAHLEPEILLVDEVLAVGDAAFQKKCLGKMGDVANEGRTVLFVSHNMPAVQQICQMGIVLNEGGLNYYGAIDAAVGRYLNEVKTLMQGFELSKRIDRKGSQWLKFTKVVIYNSEGNELQQVISGDDAVIQLHYKSEKEMRNASVLISFNVRNSIGHLLTNLNSVDTGQNLLDIYSDGYFECYWPWFNLRSGSYECNLFCSVNLEVVDWIQSAFIIDVEDGNYYKTGKLISRDQGDILINHSWTCVRK